MDSHPWLNFAPLALAVLAVILAGVSRNRYVKRRLLISLILALVAQGFVLVALAIGDVPEYAAYVVYAEHFAVFIGGLALIIGAVAVALNPLRGDGISEKWPSIIQDALVLAGLLVVAFVVAGERLLALGVASSLVFGFALRDTLGNLFSGLALQSEKPFHVGDWVSVAKREGRVEGRVLEVTWRATKFRTKSGNFVIIPNSVISQDAITNYSKPSPVMRLERSIGMGFSVPPNQFKRVVLETMADVPDILKDPKPDVLTNEYEDFCIRYRCRFWINDFGRSEPITDAFTTLLYYRLQRAGLPLPYPVRDVRISERREDADSVALDPRMAFVEKVDLFAGLGSNVKESIAQSMQRITFAAREPVIHQGEAGDSMFFIYLGSVRIVLERDGTAQEVAVLGPGQFFGEMALLTGEVRSATAFAVGDVEAFVLRKEDFREVLMEFPEVAQQISEVMGRRKESLEETSAEMARRASSPKAVQRNFLSKIQDFFGLG